MDQIVIAIVGSNALFTFIQFLITRHDRKKDPEAKLLLGIAHDRIIYLCEKAMERGWTTSGEMDNISQIYMPYAEMGGNGTGKTMFERYKNLPIKEATHEQ